MKDVNLSKAQLMDELAKLRQEKWVLQTALQEQADSPTIAEYSSSNCWFSTGSTEIFAPNSPWQQSGIMEEQHRATLGLKRKHGIVAANQIIKEQQERMSLVWKNSNDGFWDWNIATDGVYYSPRYAEMLGYAPEEMEPNFRMWQKLLHPDDITAAMGALAKHTEGSSALFEAEYRMLCKSGEWKWFLGRGQVAARNEEGQPLHLAGIILDISRRKHTEAALRKSEQYLAKAFDACPVLMSLTSFNEGRIIKVNQAFCRILDYSYADLIGRTIFDIGFWADMSDRCRVQEILKKKQSIKDMEIKFRKKSGEQRLGLYSAEIIDFDDRVSILSVLTDITEQRKMEIEMTRLDRLNVVGEMAASIAHEIRNPMTTVRGYLQLLQKNEAYHQDMDCFELMVEELDRANSIITEFLSLAKHKMLEQKPANLNEIIRKLSPLMQASAVSRDHCLVLELHDLPELLLDKREIRQLILNLLNNAIESMSVSGSIIISTFIKKKNAVLAVQDHGCGIEQELLDKMGLPFLTTKEQGTGLGLPVCYRIAARHKAKIDIESSPDGSTFYITFPIPGVNETPA